MFSGFFSITQLQLEFPTSSPVTLWRSA